MNLLNQSLKISALTLLLFSVGTSVLLAQTITTGRSACPSADRLNRQAVLLQLNCDYRQNVLSTLEGQIPEAQSDADRGDITDSQKRVFSAEVKAINNQIKVAQRTANIGCRAVELRIGTAERAQSTCDAGISTSNTTN